MARFSQNINNFLAGSAAALAGHLQGTYLGNQQAMAEAEAERQRKAQAQQQALQLFSAYQGLEQQQQAQADKPYELLLSHMKDLAPGGQATALGEALQHYGHQPASRFDMAALSRALSTGAMPSFGGTSTAPMPSTGIGGKGLTPVTPPAPAPAPDLTEARMGGVSTEKPAPAPMPMGQTAIGLGKGVAPPPATATVPTVMSPGGQPLQLAGGVPKDRLTRIQTNYGALQKIYRELPEGDPRREQIRQGISGISLNPPTEADADATEQTLNRLMFTYGGTTLGNLGRTAQALKTDSKTMRDETWPALSNANPQGLLEELLAADDDIRGMDADAKRLGVSFIAPSGWAGERKAIDEVRDLYKKGDDASIQRARDLAAQIRGRIKYNMPPAKQNAAFNSVLTAVSRLNPSDPQFEEKAKNLFEKARIPYLYTEGLNGGAAQKAWQGWLSRLSGVAPLDSRARRFIIRQGRTIAMLAGGKQLADQIPEDISRQLTPSDKLTWHRLQRVETEDYQKDQTFQSNMALAQQRLAKATGPSSERDKNVLLAANSRYAKALKTVQQLKKELDYTDEDLRGGTYLKPEERKRVVAAEAELKGATDAANAIAARITKGLPAVAMPGVPQQRSAVPQRQPARPLSPAQMRGMSTADLQARLRHLRGAP